MIRALAIYWLIGCLLDGIAAGTAMRHCGTYQFSPAEEIVFVALWPSMSTYMVTRGPPEVPVCRTIAP